MSKPHRKSIIWQTIERLDGLMAIGDSRNEAKKEARAEAKTRGEHIWSYSTGRIHAHKTRITYQEHILRFVNWARARYQIINLEQLDTRANELATLYLQQEMDAQKSPYTLQVERSALRLFFSNRTLASSIVFPRRVREQITRSRRPAVRDRRFQPAHWHSLVQFERAVGLRRSELIRIRVADIYCCEGKLVAYVANGKGGKDREVPVLPGREQDVLAVVEGRNANESIFAHLPDAADIHAFRREYAQALYQYYTSGRDLPPATGRLKQADYDLEATLRVSRALGHKRRDVVLRHYLR